MILLLLTSNVPNHLSFKAYQWLITNTHLDSHYSLFPSEEWQNNLSNTNYFLSINVSNQSPYNAFQRSTSIHPASLWLSWPSIIARPPTFTFNDPLSLTEDRLCHLPNYSISPSIKIMIQPTIDHHQFSMFPPKHILSLQTTDVQSPSFESPLIQSFKLKQQLSCTTSTQGGL